MPERCVLEDETSIRDVDVFTSEARPITRLMSCTTLLPITLIYEHQRDHRDIMSCNKAEDAAIRTWWEESTKEVFSTLSPGGQQKWFLGYTHITLKGSSCFCWPPDVSVNMKAIENWLEP